MQEVELLMDRVPIWIGKGGNAVFFINLGQRVLEVLLYVLGETDFCQCFAELIVRREHDRRC